MKIKSPFGEAASRPDGGVVFSDRHGASIVMKADGSLVINSPFVNITKDDSPDASDVHGPDAGGAKKPPK